VSSALIDAGLAAACIAVWNRRSAPIRRFPAGLVKPLQVIGDHGDLMTGRGACHQVQSRQADQEGLRRTIVLDSESRQQRPALRGRQGIRCSHDGAHQLMEPGERQLRFGFDAGRPQDKIPAFLPATGRRLDQNRLADASLAGHRKGGTGRRRRVNRCGKDLQLVLTPNDLKRGLGQRPNHALSVPQRAAVVAAVTAAQSSDTALSDFPADVTRVRGVPAAADHMPQQASRGRHRMDEHAPSRGVASSSTIPASTLFGVACRFFSPG
jgi:hypothetical protein